MPLIFEGLKERLDQNEKLRDQGPVTLWDMTADDTDIKTYAQVVVTVFRRVEMGDLKGEMDLETDRFKRHLRSVGVYIMII